MGSLDCTTVDMGFFDKITTAQEKPAHGEYRSLLGLTPEPAHMVQAFECVVHPAALRVFRVQHSVASSITVSL